MGIVELFWVIHKNIGNVQTFTLDDSSTRDIRHPRTGVIAFQFNAISSRRLKVCDSLPPRQIVFFDNNLVATENDCASSRCDLPFGADPTQFKNSFSPLILAACCSTKNTRK